MRVSLVRKHYYCQLTELFKEAAKFGFSFLQLDQTIESLRAHLIVVTIMNAIIALVVPTSINRIISTLQKFDHCCYNIANEHVFCFKVRYGCKQLHKYCL